MVRKRFDVAPKINVKDEGMLIQQAAGSTANLLEIKDAAGNTLVSYASTGIMSTSVTPSFNGGISTTNINASGNVSVTGGTTLSSNTSIGNVSSTEIGYLDGVTSNIQSQLDNKVSVANNAISQNQLSTSIPLSGMRNVLINGGMDIWQRGTAVKFNSGQGAYGPDRWCGAYQYQISRTERTTVTSAPSGLWAQYACRVSSPSTAEDGGAGARMRLEQKVESLSSIPLRGRQVTLSFWIRFSAASFTATSGQYQDFVYNIGAYTTTTDSATNTTAADVGQTGYITNGSLPTTWTKYTLSYTIPTNTNNVEVWFGFIDLGRHTTPSFNWYEVTQVQLEVGSQVTPFEQRPYGLELALCQRYYHVVGSGDLHGSFYAGTASMLFTHLPVTMRTSPTASIPAGPYTNALLDYGVAFRTPSIVSTQTATANNYAIVAYNGFGATYIPTTWYGANIPLSAEL